MKHQYIKINPVIQLRQAPPMAEQGPKGQPKMIYRVKVLPGSKKEGIVKKSPDSFQVSVKEEAERGMANKKSLEILANHLGVPVKSLRIIKGAKQRNKIITQKLI